MKRLFYWLKSFKNSNIPLITVYIHRKAILSNYQMFLAYIQAKNPTQKIAPVLKSNAYGHGLIEVARILEQSERATIPFFVIDSLFEAVALRARGIHTHLLILGYCSPEAIKNTRLSAISFGITSLDQLKHTVLHARTPLAIHLKIDTGMNRQGILTHELESALILVKSTRFITLEGICSHFADSDSSTDKKTKVQIATWNALVKRIRTEFPSLKYWHTSNTSGHAYTESIDANISRLGGGLYGLTLGAPIENTLSFIPALSITTVLSGIKKIKKGETIGYGMTYTAPHDMTIGTIPAGYNEGIDRRLSNKGVFAVGGNPAPIVGRVSMNITTLDITALQNQSDGQLTVKLGDTVTIISNDPHAPNSLTNLAKNCDTITYELAVHISPLLKRIVV